MPRGNKGKKGKSSKGRKGGGLVTSSGSSQTRTFEPWMPVFPASTVKRLRYSTSAALTGTAGVVASYVFRANDLFDPDFTSTGHQPMGVDQMLTWYNHFTVLASKITVSFKNTLTIPGTVCIRVDGDSTPLTVIDRIVEVGGAVFDTLGSFGDTTKKLSLGVDIAKIQGVSRSAITADVSLQGSASAAPIEITYFHVQLWNANGVTVTCAIDVEIEFQVQFSEPRDLTQSVPVVLGRKRSPKEVKEPPSEADPVLYDYYGAASGKWMARSYCKGLSSIAVPVADLSAPIQPVWLGRDATSVNPVSKETGGS